MGDVYPKPTEEQILLLETRFEKIAIIEFAGHTMIFQRPTYEHGLAFRRQRDAGDPAKLDNICLFTIVAFDGNVQPENKDREPLRVAFKDLLKRYPMLTDSEPFQVALANLLGMAEEEAIGSEGKGWRVSSRGLGT